MDECFLLRRRKHSMPKSYLGGSEERARSESALARKTGHSQMESDQREFLSTPSPQLETHTYINTEKRSPARSFFSSSAPPQKPRSEDNEKEKPSSSSRSSVPRKRERTHRTVVVKRQSPWSSPSTEVGEEYEIMTQAAHGSTSSQKRQDSHPFEHHHRQQPGYDAAEAIGVSRLSLITCERPGGYQTVAPSDWHAAYTVDGDDLSDFVVQGDVETAPMDRYLAHDDGGLLRRIFRLM